METGYARLVANFETITIVLNGLGASYQPRQDLIKLPSLLGKLEEAKAILLEVDNSQAAYSVAVDAGEALFKDLRRYAVNIKRVAAVELNDDAFTSGLQSIISRMSKSTQRSAPVVQMAAADGGETVTKARSGPNTGRDSRVALLGDIAALLRTRSDYQPDDPALSLEGIEQKIAALNAANIRVREMAAARAALSERRNAILFDEETGLVKRTKLIKTHLARTPGTDSAAFRRINAIYIRNK